MPAFMSKQFIIQFEVKTNNFNCAPNVQKGLTGGTPEKGCLFLRS